MSMILNAPMSSNHTRRYDFHATLPIVMGKMEENREAKRTAILEAAEATFLKAGYTDAKMDAVALTAGVTKQTLYRYFPSKLQLFDATLRHMGNKMGEPLDACFDDPDSAKALRKYALGFMKAHLSEIHLKTYRLLVSESEKSPEAIKSFFAVGPERTTSVLVNFLTERFSVSEPASLIELWFAMLLSPRDKAVLSQEMPKTKELRRVAEQATSLLLAGIHQSTD